jgi:hypothetical protein
MAGSEDRKAELIAELARARRQLDASGERIRDAIDVPARVRSNFQRHTLAWVGGAVLVGVLIAKLPRRSPKKSEIHGENVELKKAGAAGLLLATGKIAFDIFRPLLVKWLVNRAAPLAEDLVNRYSAGSQRSRE